MYTFLVIMHLIGTVLGVGGATFAEVFYLKAIKDGEIEPMESEWLQLIYRVLRIGLIITVLSGFSFLLLYRFTGLEERLLSPQLWAKMTIILILVINAFLLTIRRIPFWLGSAISFTSWYAALVIGAWGRIPYSYITIMLFYLASVVLIAIVLEIIRRSYIKKSASVS